jgi:hypothetical protein
LPTGDRHNRNTSAAETCGESGGIADMEFGDTCELFKADPFKRIDVAFFPAIGRD